MEHTYENCHNLTCRRKERDFGYNQALEEAEKRYRQAENDYHNRISKDIQSSYDLGCITTLEKIIKLAHEDVTTGNMIISLVDVEKLKDNDVLQTLININQI